MHMAPKVVPRPIYERTEHAELKHAAGLGIISLVLGHGQSIWRKAAFVGSSYLVRAGAKQGAKRDSD